MAGPPGSGGGWRVFFIELAPYLFVNYNFLKVENHPLSGWFIYLFDQMCFDIIKKIIDSFPTFNYQRVLTYLPVFIVGICLLSIGILADNLNSQYLLKESRNSVLEQISVVRARLEGNINSNTQLVRGLVSVISNEPHMTDKRFIALTKPLLQEHSELRNIAAAPDLIIRFMSPLAGNEAAVGLNYRMIPAQYDAIKHARDTGNLILAGPVNLVQGGQGFILRIPVFTKTEGTNLRDFWGVVSAVINVEKLYEVSGLSSSDNLRIAIRGKDAVGAEGDLFYGQEETFLLDPVLLNVMLPHGSWLLAAIPKEGWSQQNAGWTGFRFAMVVIALLIFLPLLVLSRIVEKKRESEADFKALFDLSPVGIALNSYETGTFIEGNEALMAAIGYSHSELMNLSYRDLTPKEYQAQEAEQKIITEKTGKYGPYEKEYIRKDGSRCPIVLNGVVIRDASGKKKIWSIIEDISARKQAEIALRRSQRMDAIGQLTGGIAHDFNNILGIILGNLQLLKKDLPADESKAHKRVDNIYKAGERASDLTKQLLGFSRNKTGPQSAYNINRLIEKMEHLISSSVTPEVEVKHQLADDLWLSKIDPGDFENSLLNLIINASHALANQGHLTITTRNAIIDGTYIDMIPGAKTGEYVEVAVSDNGEGIAPEHQERVFEPFYSTKKEGKGTGLGLTMVYGFVQRSGGFIDLHSIVGVGTSIKLYLPRIKEEEQPRKEQKVNNSAKLQGGTETILVVDDEAPLQEVARELLEPMGYRIITTLNGTEALDILKQEPSIDLLFSDVVMPGGVNGYQLAEIATVKYPGLKILLTSGFTGEVAANKNQAKFNINLLSKPYTRDQLISRVRIILDEKK